MKKTKRCICPATFLLDGEERVEWPDPDCSQHGLSEAATTQIPLMKYARRIVWSVLYVYGSGPHKMIWRSRHDRLETPREVQRRLYAESFVPRGLYLLSDDLALD